MHVEADVADGWVEGRHLAVVADFMPGILTRLPAGFSCQQWLGSPRSDVWQKRGLVLVWRAQISELVSQGAINIAIMER